MQKKSTNQFTNFNQYESKLQSIGCVKKPFAKKSKYSIHYREKQFFYDVYVLVKKIYFKFY
ncbi:hypothetical protein B0A67_02915 [Flavobacterium aquidurense]|nr:hypothetical protein B0A67_02915 [Flavobacterium aquidurense]